MCLENRIPARDRRRALQRKEESRVVLPSAIVMPWAETPDSGASDSKYLFSPEARAGQFGLTVLVLLEAPSHIRLGWGPTG